MREMRCDVMKCQGYNVLLSNRDECLSYDTYLMITSDQNSWELHMDHVSVKKISIARKNLSCKKEPPQIKTRWKRRQKNHTR